MTLLVEKERTGAVAQSERDHALDHLLIVIEGAHAAGKTIAEAIYDAGYRRGALSQEQGELEAVQLDLGEALILIGQVQECRTLDDLNAVRRYLDEFMDRYSERPLPQKDLAQAEQQEIQGAHAEYERARFEEACRKASLERGREIDPQTLEQRTDGSYLSPMIQAGWWGWQARAALAAQLAVPVAEHPVLKLLLEVALAADHALDDTEDDGESLTWWRPSFDRLSNAMDALDELPDDQPDVVMGPVAKAGWALRDLTAVRSDNHA